MSLIATFLAGCVPLPSGSTTTADLSTRKDRRGEALEIIFVKNSRKDLIVLFTPDGPFGHSTWDESSGYFLQIGKSPPIKLSCLGAVAENAWSLFIPIEGTELWAAFGNGHLTDEETKNATGEIDDQNTTKVILVFDQTGRAIYRKVVSVTLRAWLDYDKIQQTVSYATKDGVQSFNLLSGEVVTR